MLRLFRALLLCILWLCPPLPAAQNVGSAGSVEGTVADPSGLAVPGARVELLNKVSGYHQSVSTGENGAFHFPRVPLNSYHLNVTAAGFQTSDQTLQVRAAVPVTMTVQLQLAGATSSVTVEAAGSDVLENVPYAHNDINDTLFAKLPPSPPGAGLSNAITLGTPGVVADSNGFFHPLGDHAQTTFSIDGQPVSDQQSKQFSTQIPLNAVESMEVITGAPTAEFGDKTSLIVNAATKSGIGKKPFGSFTPQYGSFGLVGEEGTLGFGSAKLGNFLAANVLRSGRFLDTPEFHPMHAIGNNYAIFDHIDYRPNSTDAFHLNLFQARNWFQVPNTYDQPAQDQRQKTLTYNVAPGYQHTFNPTTLLTVNLFFREDQVGYYRSADIAADTPASPQESRRLVNWGTRSDLSYVNGIHNVKVGVQLMQTRLTEQFTLGITDPNFVDPATQPGLVPYDLTRGGRLFQFAGRANINQYAGYAQDTLTWRNWSFTPGVRIDRYDGLASDTRVQPRIGASYRIAKSGTVLRGAYSRTLETPYNENLILSSATGAGGLAANAFGARSVQPVPPGLRTQYNGGFQQSLHNKILIDADAFWKFTDNAFDFATLLNTPVTFPISWKKSKIDGVAARITMTETKGFQAYVDLGHSRARFFGPSNGGLIFNAPLDTGVFRIDHDQAFEQTTHVQYQFPKKGPWIGFTWRYDSGMVASAVPDLAAALSLTAAQQSAIGFFCGSAQATLAAPITGCASPNWGAVRLRIPSEGTGNNDSNPTRIAPRNLFNLAIGDDNLFHFSDKYRISARLYVENLGNAVALYNFLSTFSGTHFVGPRSYRAEIGFDF